MIGSVRHEYLLISFSMFYLWCWHVPYIANTRLLCMCTIHSTDSFYFLYFAIFDLVPSSILTSWMMMAMLTQFGYCIQLEFSTAEILWIISFTNYLHFPPHKIFVKKLTGFLLPTIWAVKDSLIVTYTLRLCIIFLYYRLWIRGIVLYSSQTYYPCRCV